MSSSDLEDVECRMCNKSVSYDDISACGCNSFVHSSCLVEFIRYKRDLGLEARCEICLELFEYTSKSQCYSQMCSDIGIFCDCKTCSEVLITVIMGGMSVIGLAIYASMIMMIINGFGLTKPYSIFPAIPILAGFNTIYVTIETIRMKQKGVKNIIRCILFCFGINLAVITFIQAFGLGICNIKNVCFDGTIHKFYFNSLTWFAGLFGLIILIIAILAILGICNLILGCIRYLNRSSEIIVTR